MFRSYSQAEVMESLLAHDAKVEEISPLDIGEDRLVGLLETCAESLGNAVLGEPTWTHIRGYVS